MRRGRSLQVHEVREVPVRGLRGRNGDGPCERGEVHTKEGNLISTKMERNLCLQFGIDMQYVYRVTIQLKLKNLLLKRNLKINRRFRRF